jgi:hypothetical protein
MSARTKKGRRTTGHDAVATIRLSPELRESVDAWAAKQSDKPARPEAILRFVELRLETTHRRESAPNRAAKASALAAQEKDRISIRQQPRKNANFASGDLSKDRKSSGRSARNRVRLTAMVRYSASGVKSFAKYENPARFPRAGSREPSRLFLTDASFMRAPLEKHTGPEEVPAAWAAN